MSTKRPRCETCNSHHDVHATNRPGQIEGAHGALRWICAACEYADRHAEVRHVEPYHKPKVPQEESLW